MRNYKAVILAASAAALAVPQVSPAHNVAEIATGERVCFSLASMKTVNVNTLAGGESDCDGSVNTFFSGLALTGLTDEELIETAVVNCGLPNGPYKRADTDLDYLLVEASAVNSTTTEASITAAEINSTIGTNVSNGLEISISLVAGAKNNDPALLTVTTPAEPRSQILDLPGWDFLWVAQSSGGGSGQSALLICDVKAWFFDSSLPNNVGYGVKNLPVNININWIVAGFAAGPSGLSSQANVDAVCNIANAAGEKFVSHIVGSYKITSADPNNPVDASACTPPGEDPIIANNCDNTEAFGSVDFPQWNACNPDGEAGGVAAASLDQVNGSASCQTFFRGTPINFGSTC